MIIFAYATRYFASSIGSIENGFSKIDSSIDDATKIFGKSELNNIIKVYLPLMKPYIIDRVENSSSNIVKQTKEQKYKTLMTSDEAKQLRKYM